MTHPSERVWMGSTVGAEIFPGLFVGQNDVLADIGCGGGGMSMAAAHAGAKVYAVDISSENAAAAAEKLAAFSSAEVRLATSDTIPIDDSLATKILCVEVLEHVLDPVYFASELARIGQPGAEYIISVPDALSEGVLKEVTPDYMWRAPHHVRIFERGQFRALIEGAGLAVTDTRYVGFYWSMWWALRFASGSQHHPGGADPPAVLQRWEETWAALNASTAGREGARALDRGMPKSQVIYARK